MRIVADLHIHSPYARAVSREMTLENLDRWARIKGITVMGTGDFTHPAWIREIRKNLEPAEPGLYALKGMAGIAPVVRFLLTVEISSIYKKNGKARRIHTLVFVPSIETAENLNRRLAAHGNIRADGRPILGMGVKELAELAWDADSRAEVVPGHCWTPWFGILGSMSGFDSLEECFDEVTPRIRMVETGLSSDPAMNWRVPFLDTVGLISNSDAHSLSRIGREANVVEAELSYGSILDALASRDPARFLCTIEFFPEEGKYHYDGHRACGVSLAPPETKKLGARCPVCGRPLTVGVLHRVEDLAGRPEGFRPRHAVPFRSLVPLDEIIGQVLGAGVRTKKVQAAYAELVQRIGSEFAVLVDAPIADLRAASEERLAEAVRMVREGHVKIVPGFDGEYGRVELGKSGNAGASRISPQCSLFS